MFTCVISTQNYVSQSCPEKHSTHKVKTIDEHYILSVSPCPTKCFCQTFMKKKIDQTVKLLNVGPEFNSPIHMQFHLHVHEYVYHHACMCTHMHLFYVPGHSPVVRRVALGYVGVVLVSNPFHLKNEQ